MTDDGIAAVVCMRVDKPGVYVVPGSVQVHCARCNAPVWVAQSSFKMMFGTPKLFICTRCIHPEEAGHLGEAVARGPEPVQAAELAQYQDEIEEHFRG
jgi:hypothetical protein